MNYPYIIIDDDQESVLKTKAIADGFSELAFLATANTYSEGLNIILEHNPKLIFLEIDPADTASNLSLALINELYRYLKVIPKIIITTNSKELAFEAIQYEVAEYLIKPIKRIDLIKSILKIKKSISEDEVIIAQHPVANAPHPTILYNTQSTTVDYQEFKAETQVQDDCDKKTLSEQPQSAEDNQDARDAETQVLDDSDTETLSEQLQAAGDSKGTIATETQVLDETKELVETQIPEIFVQQVVPVVEQPLILCIKSYGDYRYIDANDICYFQADNNSTDINLNNGEMITAFKTLKHFEGVLPFPFARIHNSYIVNRNYISRIHTGNAVCYIKNTTTKLPFSKSYKENVDTIISEFANGNYLEI